MRELSAAIIQSKINRLYLFQCLSEIQDFTLKQLVSALFENGVLNLSNHTLQPKDIDTLIYILNRSQIAHWDELNLSHCNIGDAGFNQFSKALSNFNHKISFDKINLISNQLTIDSLHMIPDVLVCCKVQELWLSDDFSINSDVKLMYIAMNYAFEDTDHKYPITILFI